MARKQVAFRVTDEQDRMLEELARITQKTRNDVIVDLIVGEYDRINGNPELKKLIEKMNEVSEQVKKYTAGKKE